MGGRERASVHAIEMRYLREDLAELKARVERLETTLARGVMLLVANLVGVVLTLAQQLLGR
jgi:hypothetical protein